MFVLKTRHSPELSEANCNADSAPLETIAKIIIQWHYFVHWRKDVSVVSVHWMTDSTHTSWPITKMSRTKRLRTPYDRRWVTRQRVESGWQYTNFTLVDHKIKANEAFCRTSMVLQQFLPPYVISQASSSSFSKSVFSLSPAQRGLETISLLTRNITRCWPISKILSKQTQQ